MPMADTHARLAAAVPQLRATLRRTRLQPIVVGLLRTQPVNGGVPRARFVTILAAAADGTIGRSRISAAHHEQHALAARFVYDTIAGSSTTARSSVSGDALPDALVAGLSILATASEDEVCGVVFAAFDEKRTNSLGLAEMELYLHIVLVLSMRLKEVGASSSGGSIGSGDHGAAARQVSGKAKKMAKKMAKKTFTQMDCDHSGAISRAEFAQWLRSVVGAPSDAQRVAMQSTRDATPQHRILRRLHGCADYAADDFADANVRHLHATLERVATLEAANDALSHCLLELVERVDELERASTNSKLRAEEVQGRTAAVALPSPPTTASQTARTPPSLSSRSPRREVVEDRLIREIGYSATLSVGHRVDVVSSDGVKITGTVRALAADVTSGDVMVGLELQRRYAHYGDGDGERDGKRHFKCPTKRALWLPRAECYMRRDPRRSSSSSSSRSATTTTRRRRVGAGALASPSS